MTKRLIEEFFPTKEVGESSAHEKNIRRRHISSLHPWWARKPLASSRTTAYAALIPAPQDERELENKSEFIINLAKWESSVNSGFIDKARQDILTANGGVPPCVLDPFAGGGAIPLEAIRLGCKTFASDLNPVAVLIEKATLEYPQKYGEQNAAQNNLLNSVNTDQLVEDVQTWGRWVLQEAKKEIERFYGEDGSTSIGYIWARTIPCQNPTCGRKIPLISQFWLSKKKNQQISLFPYVANGEVQFRIVGTGYEQIPKDFIPGKGTTSKAIATCLICGSTIGAKTVRQLFRDGKAGQRLVAVVLNKPGMSGKLYRTATANDSNVFKEAEKALARKNVDLFDKWHSNLVPDEKLPEERMRGSSGFRVLLYDIKTWGDLFNARQKLSLITFLDQIKTAYEKMVESGLDSEYSKAIVVYLGLIFDKLVVFSSSNCTWKVDTTQVRGAFVGRQALQMTWDYFEMNPISGVSASWPNLLEVFSSSLDTVPRANNPATCSQASATSLPYQDNFFDAVFTDPPYYDNVAYADLSDFFYVWLKRILGDIFPDFFSTPLTPKNNEIIQDPGRLKDKLFFEMNMAKSFKEIYRVLKPDGIATIVYAHKSFAGWETLINSLLDSSLIITAAWPLNTEMGSRMNANQTASLASSIYLVARKQPRQQTGFYNEVKRELTQHLNKKLDRLWKEGISGADFFIAAIGSAIEVFGKYEKVIDYEGNVIRADKLLDDIQTIATDYAVKQILHNGFGGVITDLTRFYVLWRWNYGEARVQFDDARKLAQSCGIDLSQEWGKHGFIQKEGGYIRVLGPDKREIDALKASQLIDILHYSCLLWSTGKRDEMVTILDESGFGNNEAFYRVAQAISETLPNESKEKKLLDGFLASKERIKHDIKNGVGPTTLSDW